MSRRNQLYDHDRQMIDHYLKRLEQDIDALDDAGDVEFEDACGSMEKIRAELQKIDTAVGRPSDD